jgi:hypothetical protein
MGCDGRRMKIGDKWQKYNTVQSDLPISPLLSEKNASSAKAPVCAPAPALQ